MNTICPETKIRDASLAVTGAETTFVDGWSIHTFEQLPSTNSVAAPFPAWSAVRARVQTAGRGRTGRAWVSNRGGLWLSAVLPCPAEESVWPFLPLAVGWGLQRCFRHLGLHGVRLRWPNDLMVGRQKLAGILVERFNPGCIVVGVGVNVFNFPEAVRTDLGGFVTRLADHLDQPDNLEILTRKILRVLRNTHDELWCRGFRPIAAELNSTWLEPQKVRLLTQPDVPPVVGQFLGIDAEGRLRVRGDDHAVTAFDANQVSLLTEIE